MNLFQRRTQSGIIVPNQPKPVGVKCYYCPTIIFKHQEAGGRLFLMQGKPACARCRILNHSKLKKQIIADKAKFVKDRIEQNEIKQRNENIRVAKIALETQRATGTGLKHKK